MRTITFIKRFCLLLFFVNIGIFGNAQNASKSETENWIQSKLDKYVVKNYKVHTDLGINPRDILFESQFSEVKNLSFRFSGDYLVASYTDVRKNSSTPYSISIPIYNIKSLYCSDNSSLGISTKDETIIEHDLTTNSKRVTNYFSFFFECKAETDLTNRMEKAFIHLGKYYKKPVKKEAF